MAFEFAKKGLNVILISRSQDKLDATASEITAKYPQITVKVLSIDYSAFDEKARQTVGAFIAGLDIGVLVNNVGVSYPYTQFFHELEDERVTQLVTLNVDSTTWMSRIVLPGMIERKRGAIVNIGSGKYPHTLLTYLQPMLIVKFSLLLVAAGVANSPLLAQYGAAKSYIAMFSRALHYELSQFNIDVQCQVPLFVATKLAKIKKASLFVASPSGYARAAVASIGYETVVSPFWSHALQMYFLLNLPEFIVANITKRMHLDIRKKGLKKDQDAAANKDKKA
jgi:17beta-estradiol 17-dehydrogenase / very-long-chain 3-oxoacyl-CoA reductase